MRAFASAAGHGCQAMFAALLLLAAPAAFGGANCSITAVSLNFGVYDTARAQPDDSVGSVTVTCAYVPPNAANIDYVVTLSNGLNSATAAGRTMAAGSQRLGYNVYDDVGRTRLWGNGTVGTVVASGKVTVGPGVGNGARTLTHTIYGRIPALQDAAPGSYVDALVVTLTY